MPALGSTLDPVVSHQFTSQFNFCHGGAAGKIFIYLENGGIFMSADDGENWSNIWYPSEFGYLDEGCLRNYYLPPNLENLDWDIASRFYLAIKRSSPSSTNGGLFWAIYPNYWQKFDGWLSAEQVDACVGADGVNKIVAFGKRSGDAVNRLYYSFDDGQSWNLAPINPNYPNIRSIRINPENTSQVWLATSGQGVIIAGGFGTPNQIPFVINGNFNIVEDVYFSRDVIIAPNSSLNIINSATLTFAEGKKIIIADGGELNISAEYSKTFTSNSGQWGGIVFQGTGYGTVSNCTFYNTNTPIKINGNSGTPTEHINISNCTFNDGYVEIDSRPLVTVQNCNWSYSGSYIPDVCGVNVINSDTIVVQDNTITSVNPLNSIGISIVYGNTISLVHNTLTNLSYGISISNSSPYVTRNTVTNNSTGQVGIAFDNSYASVVNENNITGYNEGFKLGYSSPTMLENSSYTTWSTYSFTASYYSYPRLCPNTGGDGDLIIDAGYNTLRTDNIAMKITNSIPNIDYGCNTINSTNTYNIEAEFGTGGLYTYLARNNDWITIPVPGKFNFIDASIEYSPYGCQQGAGGGLNMTNENYKHENVTPIPPPQPIIVNRGNGFFDTLIVNTKVVELSQDKLLFDQAKKQELLGNYAIAINTYKQVIQNYPSSTSAVNALKRIMDCYDKNNSDSIAYIQLQSYYTDVAQQNQTDTALTKVSKELELKTLVRLKSYPSAITGYENIVSSSNDSLEILYTELNIIETYLLIHQSGDAPSFTGKLSNLKPNSIKDGIRMIKEKLFGKTSINHQNVIPNEFALMQNYPNPFNPLTKIKFSLPRNEKVSIKVYDLLGRLVKELVNENKEAGSYEITFDGSNFASGVYIYRIEAGKFVQAKKMVLIK